MALTSGSEGDTARPLVLPPVPAAAGAARRYVSAVLSGLGYAALVEAGVLGTSELVTNATIHARTDITVQVRDLGHGVARIEVQDGSPVLPVPHRYGTTSGVGRGLRMLEAYGTWGVEPHLGQDGGPGKVVWFQPAQDPDPQGFELELGPAEWDGEDRADQLRGEAGSSSAVLGRYDPGTNDTLVTVRLLRFPLQLFAAAREHHDELIRELSLLALASADGAHRPQAGQAATPPDDLRRLVEVLGGRYRAAADRGDAVRDAALARGELTIDLTYQVPASTRESMLSLSELMEQADRLCRREQLLTLAEEPVLRDFRRWFSDQFVDQIDGAVPSPWPGPLTKTSI